MTLIQTIRAMSYEEYGRFIKYVQPVDADAATVLSQVRFGDGLPADAYDVLATALREFREVEVLKGGD